MPCSRTFLPLVIAWAIAPALSACKPYDPSLVRSRTQQEQDTGRAGSGMDGGGAGKGGTGACVPGPELCNREDDDCDGTTDEDTLAACESVVLNAETDCVLFGKTAGCLLLACRAGYEDCDGNPANGCEPYCACHDCDGGPSDGGADLDAN